MDFLQPQLSDALICIEPLVADHFEALFSVASDPLIWEQHPNKFRYKEEVFRHFFDEGIDSKGALLVRDTVTGDVIGCSRYYEWNSDRNEVKIGYTFLARKYWGGLYNRSLKTVMLKNAFTQVDRVIFEVGAGNKRSQLAMAKIGGVKIGESEINFPGEAYSLNFVYAIDKKDFAI